jgi:hypothetical protein
MLLFFSSSFCIIVCLYCFSSKWCYVKQNHSMSCWYICMMQTCQIENKRGNQEWTIRDNGNILGTHDTERIQTKQKNTTYHINLKTNNIDPTKNWFWFQVSVTGKRFLLLNRHPPCNSYTQESQIKVLSE